eukprot:363864-Chlamydomonas_euryale.AAC.27
MHAMRACMHVGVHAIHACMHAWTSRCRKVGAVRAGCRCNHMHACKTHVPVLLHGHRYHTEHPVRRLGLPCVRRCTAHMCPAQARQPHVYKVACSENASIVLKMPAKWYYACMAEPRASGFDQKVSAAAALDGRRRSERPQATAQKVWASPSAHGTRGLLAVSFACQCHRSLQSCQLPRKSCAFARCRRLHVAVRGIYASRQTL